MFGSIYFRQQPDSWFVRRLRLSAVVATVGLFALCITGVIPDHSFASGSTFSGTFTNQYGTSSTMFRTAAWRISRPLFLDMMGHVSLIVPGLALVILALVVHYREQVVTASEVRSSVLSLMFLTGVWMLVLGMIGGYLAKILAFPLGR